MQDLLPQLIDSGWKLGALLLSLLLAWVTRALTARLQAGAARDAALELVTVAETSVRHIAQTLRPELEKAAADGKLSPEDLAELKSVAIASTRDQLNNATLRLIASNSERVEGVIGRAVEAAVHRQKEAAAARPAAVTLNAISVASEAADASS